MSPVPITQDTNIYIGDTSQTLKEIRDASSDHRDFRDNINSVFGADPLKNKKAINWEQRFNEGLIEDGVVKQTWNDRLIGRSQEELQLAYETWRQKSLKKQLIPLNARRTSEGFAPVEFDTNVNSSTLTANSLQLEKVITNRDALLNIDGGPQAFAALGDNPTSTQILSATSALQAEINKPERDRAIVLHNDQLKNSKEQRLNNTAAAALSRDNYNLNSTIAQRNQGMNEWKIKDAAAQRTFAEQEATRRAAFDMENSNSDRSLQLQLAEMSSGERRDDREYNRDRDSRKERQLMILQLMKGLQGLGGAFQ